jgi:hypothetical protein
MKLSKFNDAGIAHFAEFIARIRAGESLDSPFSMLVDHEFSIEVGSVQVDVSRVFRDRLECGAYLQELLSGADHSLERDAGLWAWLSVVYFDQLCPPDRLRTRKVGEQARYIPEPMSFQKFYRHLLVGPFLIYRAHADDPERARALLVNPLSSPGEIVEQLASRQELVTNRAVVAVATELYVDRDSGSLKRGAGGKGAGSPRRLADFINQVDLTHDVYAMAANELLALLPKEFQRFKPIDAATRASLAGVVDSCAN